MKLTSTFLLLILSVFIVAIFAVNYNPPIAVRNMAAISQDTNLVLLDPPPIKDFIKINPAVI